MEAQTPKQAKTPARGEASIRRTPSMSDQAHGGRGGFRVGVLFFTPHYTPKRVEVSSRGELIGVAPHHRIVCPETGNVLYEFSHSDYDIGCGQRLQAPDTEVRRKHFKEAIVQRMIGKLGLGPTDRIVLHKTGYAGVDIFVSTAQRAHDVTDQLDEVVESADIDGVFNVWYQRTEVDLVMWSVGTELVYFGPRALSGCDIPVTVMAQLSPTDYEVRFETDMSSRTVHSRHLAEPGVDGLPVGGPPVEHEITLRLSVNNPETGVAGIAQMDRMAVEAEREMEEAINRGDLESACNAGARMGWWRTHARRLRYEARNSSI